MTKINKHSIPSLLLCLALVIGLVVAGLPLGTVAQAAPGDEFAGGAGTAADPWQISTPEQLAALTNYTGTANSTKHFKLTGDIDLTSYLAGAGNDGGQGWKMIGANTTAGIFHGTLDGANHKVTGLWINRTTTDYVGLIARVGDSGVVKNLGVVIDNANGGIKGAGWVGGLTSYLSGTAKNCYVIGNVSGTGNFVGSIAATQNTGLLEACYANSNVSGASFIGGLLGNQVAEVKNCYALGNANGTKYVGGLIGRSNGSTVSSCYSIGTATGPVASTGALIGESNSATVKNCFYDATTSGMTKGVGNAADAAGVVEAKTTAQMKAQTTYPAAWLFTGASAVWAMQEGITYPQLQAMLFASGDGSAANPYIITTPQQFDNLRFCSGTNGKNRYFKLGNDIDFTDYLASSSTGFSIIPGNTYIKLDGAGHSVSGLWINTPTAGYTAIFEALYAGAEIKNMSVILDDAKGGIAGNNFVGGIVALQDGATIENCYVQGKLTASGNRVGGIAASFNNGTIKNCYADVVVKGADYVGGIAGRVGGAILNCYATGASTASSTTGFAGGIGGRQLGGSITNCYSLVKSEGGATKIGAVVGEKTGGTIAGCYYDKHFTALTKGISNVADAAGAVEAKDPQDMVAQSTFVGWDFATAWAIEDGITYPYLTWQKGGELSDAYAIENAEYTYGGDTQALTFEDNVADVSVDGTATAITLSADAPQDGTSSIIPVPALTTENQVYTGYIFGKSESGILALYTVNVKRIEDMAVVGVRAVKTPIDADEDAQFTVFAENLNDATLIILEGTYTGGAGGQDITCLEADGGILVLSELSTMGNGAFSIWLSISGGVGLSGTADLFTFDITPDEDSEEVVLTLTGVIIEGGAKVDSARGSATVEMEEKITPPTAGVQEVKTPIAVSDTAEFIVSGDGFIEADTATISATYSGCTYGSFEPADGLSIGPITYNNATGTVSVTVTGDIDGDMELGTFRFATSAAGNAVFTLTGVAVSGNPDDYAEYVDVQAEPLDPNSATVVVERVIPTMPTVSVREVKTPVPVRTNAAFTVSGTGFIEANKATITASYMGGTYGSFSPAPGLTASGLTASGGTITVTVSGAINGNMPLGTFTFATSTAGNVVFTLGSVKVSGSPAGYAPYVDKAATVGTSRATVAVENEVDAPTASVAYEVANIVQDANAQFNISGAGLVEASSFELVAKYTGGAYSTCTLADGLTLDSPPAVANGTVTIKFTAAAPITGSASRLVSLIFNTPNWEDVSLQILSLKVSGKPANYYDYENLAARITPAASATVKVAPNEASLLLACDVNQDGIINISDMSLVSRYYTTTITSTTPAIVKRCDINRDGNVDMVDMMLIVARMP